MLDLKAAKDARAARIKAKADRLGVDTGIEASADAKESAPAVEAKTETAPKAKRTRSVKTGASSKKEKQESA